MAASPAVTSPASSALPQDLPSASDNVRRRRHGLPRFLTGTLTGVTTGIALGVTAAVLFTIASPDLRSAVIVGASFDEPPVPGGEYVARVMAQAMNPNLAYADETGVAALMASTEPEMEDALVVTPMARELEDNAALIFGVLAVLTVLTWSAIMLGLSGGGSKMAGAGVE